MLELRSLNASYGESQILWDINMSIAGGQRVSVLGRNGVGKTTLMKSIMNGGPRISGDVIWQGEVLGALPHFKRVRRGMSLVPEDRRIFSHMTVVDNLELAAQGVGVTNGLTVDAMLEHFEALKPLRARYGNQLSGGQQQLLAIARGLMQAPKLLLLDEPTEGVAPILVEEMARTVISMCEQNKFALLLSEQNLWFARRCTDFIYVLDAGSVVFRGSWAEFDAQPAVRSRYLAI